MINRIDLLGEEVLTIDENHLYHRQVTELCQTLGATTRRDFEGTSLDTLRQMVVMGMGITFYHHSTSRPRLGNRIRYALLMFLV